MMQETLIEIDVDAILKILGAIGTIIYWIWLIKYVRKGGMRFKTIYYKRPRKRPRMSSEYTQYEKHNPKHPNRGKK
jgi:hypothetical protein